MAEVGKGVNAGKLAINVQKRLTRAQEKVMQKLGKADETKDMAFEEGVANFNKQLAEGTKLQKDLKAYLTAVKTMHECSKRLHDCLAEMYDPEWFGKEEMDSLAEEMIEREMDNNLEDTDLLWQDFHQKLADNAMITMDNYLAQFPDIKARIAKRDRKMVDFDSARHHFASIQKGKKKDEAKIAKAEEELGRAQKVFEEINYDLQEELPTLWDSRVGLYITTFQNISQLEDKFHRDMGNLNQNLSDIMTKLDEQRLAKKGGKIANTGKSEEAGNNNLSDSGSDVTKSPAKSRERPSRPVSSQEMQEDNIINLLEDAVVPDINLSTQTEKRPSWDSWETPAADPSLQWESDDEAQSYGQPYEAPQWDDDTPSQPNQHTISGQETEAASTADWEEDNDGHWDKEASQIGQDTVVNCSGTESDTQGWEAEPGPPDWEEPQSNEAPTTNGSSDAELPPSVLYKVKAMHDYAATDCDELELKSGDIVLVIPFANPDEQDDGWLMGVKESYWLQNKNLNSKGVFPENFTQKL